MTARIKTIATQENILIKQVYASVAVWVYSLKVQWVWKAKRAPGKGYRQGRLGLFQANHRGL